MAFWLVWQLPSGFWERPKMPVTHTFCQRQPETQKCAPGADGSTRHPLFLRNKKGDSWESARVGAILWLLFLLFILLLNLPIGNRVTAEVAGMGVVAMGRLLKLWGRGTTLFDKRIWFKLVKAVFNQQEQNYWNYSGFDPVRTKRLWQMWLEISLI